MLSTGRFVALFCLIIGFGLVQPTSTLAQALPPFVTAGNGGGASEPEPANEAAADEASTGPASRAELQALLDILDDPAAVARLRDQLETVLTAERSSAIPPAEPALEGPDVAAALQQALPAAQTLLDQVEETIRTRIEAIGRTLHRIEDTLLDLPGLLRWAAGSLDEFGEWRQLLAVSWPIAGVLAGGIAIMLLASRLLRPARDALTAPEGSGLPGKLLRLVPLTIIRAVPILVFAVLINGIIVMFSPDDLLRLAFAAAVTAIVSVQLIMVIVRAILAPSSANARLMPISDKAARTITGYVHKVLSLAVYGNTLIFVLSQYGTPDVLVGTMRNVVALLVLIFTIVGILRDRYVVAEAIARLDDNGRWDHWTEIPWRYISRTWHVVAILFTVSLFIIYMLQGQELFLRVLGIAALSLGVLAGLVILLRYVEANQGRLGGSIDELEDDEDDEPAGVPAGDDIQSRSSPVLILLRLAILAVAILTFFEVWGISTWSWLFSGESRLSQSLMRIFTIIAVIYLIWLGTSNMIASYIARLQARTTAERSTNRTRTALVLARNALFVTLCIIGVMSILPQLGVDIAPLLAGAGVLGIAIGFGSQRLVQDIISGLFNLIEDNFAVGDVVDLGGKAGVVEAVTIRTVRLRDLGGNVHTVPFSAIDVVTNMTKEFSCAVFEVGVAYREDVDQVIGVIEAVGNSLRRERAYRRVILDPLEMFGLDSLGDSSVNIKCRIKVRPGSQWMISREFNRRLKKRFDELGIEIPFPHQTLYFGTERDGSAPPAHIMLERDASAVPKTTDKIATAAS